MYNWDISGFATYPAGTTLLYKKFGTVIQAEAGKTYDTLKYAPATQSGGRPGFPTYSISSPEPYMSSPGSKINLTNNETNNETNQTNMNYNIPSYVNGVLVPGNYAPGTPTTFGGASSPQPQVQQPASQPVQPTQQPTTQPTQSGYINMGGAFFQQTANGLQAVNDANILNQLRSGAIQSTSQGISNQQFASPTQQPVQQTPLVAPQQAPQAPQQGGQYINANGAYFQQTPQGLATVNDPTILQGLMSGQIQSTQGGLGSQQLTGMTQPNLVPESARNATAEQGLQFVAQSNPQLAESIMSSLGYTGSPEVFDAQYGTMAQTNPLEFVQSVYSQLIQNSGLMDIKSQFENFTTKVEELTNDMNDEIADINDNPWLVEGVRIKRIQRVQEKYEGRINSATASMKYLNGLYSDGLAEARFLTQQTMSIYNDQVDFEQQLYRDALMRAEDRADAQTKMEFDLQKAAMTKAGGKEVEDNQTSQMVNQVLDGFQKIGDLTPSAQQKVKTELYGMGFGSDTPPEWFREFIQDQRQMTLTPTALQSEWIKYRDSIMKQSSTKSGGVSFDDL